MVLYRLSIVSLIFGLCLTSCARHSEDHARIAVATNFLGTAQKLEAAFEGETDYTLDLISGSTGQLYTQIINGAPYDAFLSADAARVTQLNELGYGIDTTQMTYALGQLVLFGAEDAEVRLKKGKFMKLALANPDLAPYGLAAEDTLNFMGLSGIITRKTVYGQNVGQVYGFVKTGNAELGFVALSQMQETLDKYWVIPKNYYDIIRQDAILLSFGEKNKSAKAFLNYLQTPQAHKVIKLSGYEVPSDG